MLFNNREKPVYLVVDTLISSPKGDLLIGAFLKIGMNLGMRYYMFCG